MTEKSLAGIAKDMKVQVQKSPGLTRGGSDTTFSAELVEKIFEAKPQGIAEGQPRSLLEPAIQWLDWLNALASGRTDSERTP